MSYIYLLSCKTVPMQVSTMIITAGCNVELPLASSSGIVSIHSYTSQRLRPRKRRGPAVGDLTSARRRPGCLICNNNNNKTLIRTTVLLKFVRGLHVFFNVELSSSRPSTL